MRGPAGGAGHDSHRRIPPSLDPDATPYALRHTEAASTGFATKGEAVPLDPAIKTVLDQLESAGGPALHEVSPGEAREMMKLLTAIEGEPEAVARVENRTIAGVPVRVYGGDGGPQPILVWYHGGGWVIGDLDTADGVARKLANRANALVVSVDYRLAPEHPYPAPVDDCWAVLEWVAANGAELGGDPARIAVGGDSAGGNLAAVMAIKARDAGLSLREQLLVYPATDLTLSFPSIDENGEGYLLTKDSMVWFTNHYLGGADPKEPTISPYYADDVSGVAPAHIITAEFDPLRDEGEAYGERLKDAGVAVEAKRYDGMIHGFYGLAIVTPVADEAIESSAAGLRAALA
jgi:acetyl esterase